MQYIELTEIDSTPMTAAFAEASFEEKVAGAVGVIKQQIMQGKRLVVACSFGKDSSVTLALTLMAMQELKAAGVVVPELHVMNSDTLLENPVVHTYSKGMIRSLKAFAKEENLPVRMWVCSPSLSNNYLVNIIGGRTIASMPGSSAKCQQQLKAVPLERTKRKIRALVKAELGEGFVESDLITLIGTRRDESQARARNMSLRGESASKPVNLDEDKGGDRWVLSPIADFTTLDVFEFLGNVTSNRIKTFSDFQALTEVYRDSAAGECMVNIYFSGRAESKTSCGARHGCWTCTRVSTDRSMENMLQEESGKYLWMKPLNAFRNYLKARHYDPKARNWLARTVNPQTGMIKVSPNAYSPDFTLELLRYALSIDAEEAVWAQANRKAPRFQLLGLKEVMAISLLWGRYAYQEPFTALREYKEIFEQGKRYPIPDDYEIYERKDLDVSLSMEVPFVDRHFNDFFEGLRDSSAAVADSERLVEKNGIYYTDANTADEFSLDDEGVELFFDFELDRALEYYGPHTDTAPSEVVHYLIRYGAAQINKGGHSEWDRILRVGNQIHRHGLKPYLHDAKALVERLTEIFNLHRLEHLYVIEAPPMPRSMLQLKAAA